jgi:hypothetical protein
MIENLDVLGRLSREKLRVNDEGGSYRFWTCFVGCQHYKTGPDYMRQAPVSVSLDREFVG